MGAKRPIALVEPGAVDQSTLVRAGQVVHRPEEAMVDQVGRGRVQARQVAAVVHRLGALVVPPVSHRDPAGRLVAFGEQAHGKPEISH